MKKWITLVGIAAMAMAPAAFAAERGGSGYHYSNPQPNTCSDGNSCPSTWQRSCPCQQGCSSQQCCDPCCNNCCCPDFSCFKCCGYWDFEGAALYWRRCADDGLFAITTSEVAMAATNTWSVVRPDSEWGFRLKGQYTSCDRCRFASLAYTYFDETDNARVLSPTIFSYFSALPRSIDARVKVEYQRLDGRVGHYICGGCKGGFYGYGGLGWLYLRDSRRLKALTSDFLIEEINFSSRYSAAAFQAGLGGDYRVWCGFGLAAEFGVVAAIGQRNQSFAGNAIAPNVSFARNRVPHLTQCVPGLDFKLEANYEWCFCGFTWGLMIGYEQHYYFGPLALNRFFFGALNNPSAGLTAVDHTDTRDFGVGGLYFGARVGY